MSTRALAAASLTLLFACGRPTPPRDLNLLILSVDTLRADHLGAYGNDEWGTSPSPVMDALAARGVRVVKHYVPRGQTRPSIASFVTGKYPITHGVRENEMPLLEQHTTLFEHLDEAGFQTGIFLSNFWFDGPIDAWAARGAQVQADGSAGNFMTEARNESRYQSTWDQRVEKSALEFLDQVDTSAPFALWAHFYDVHKPYNPPQSHRRRFGYDAAIEAPLTDPGRDSGNALEQRLAEFTFGQRDPTQAELRRVRGLYDETVAATDDRLGRILDRLETLGELENTIVVLTADHGEELYDHNRYFFHGSSIYDGVVTVPLILAGPGLPAGRVVADTTQNVDMAPTLLAMLGLPPDGAHEGHDLGPLLSGATEESPREFAFIEWQDLIYAISDGRAKLILNRDHYATRKPPWAFQGVSKELGFEIDCVEAYDLTQDAGERRNLLEDVKPSELTAQAAPWRDLYRALGTWRGQPDHQTPFGASLPDDPEARAAIEKSLQALGYLAAGGGAVNRPDSVHQESCEDS